MPRSDWSAQAPGKPDYQALIPGGGGWSCEGTAKSIIKDEGEGVRYKGEPVGEGFKADLVVAGQVILEIKSVATILSVHELQLRTYLRMSGIRVGLLLNFNAPRLMDGLRRFVV